MTEDYFEAKQTGGGKDSIEITVEVKTDKVMNFANEISSAVKDDTIDRILEIIDKLYDDTCDRYSKVGYMESARNELRMCRQAVLDLKEGEQG